MTPSRLSRWWRRWQEARRLSQALAERRRDEGAHAEAQVRGHKAQAAAAMNRARRAADLATNQRWMFLGYSHEASAACWRALLGGDREAAACHAAEAERWRQRADAPAQNIEEETAVCP